MNEVLSFSHFNDMGGNEFSDGDCLFKFSEDYRFTPLIDLDSDESDFN